MARTTIRPGEQLAMKSAFGVGVAGLVLAALRGARPGAEDGLGRRYTAEQARAGRRSTARVRPVPRRSLSGVESAPPLTGDQFNNNWEGLALSGPLRPHSHDDAANPARTLSRAQNADVLAHMLKVAGFPVGKSLSTGRPGRS